MRKLTGQPGRPQGDETIQPPTRPIPWIARSVSTEFGLVGDCMVSPPRWRPGHPVSLLIGIPPVPVGAGCSGRLYLDPDPR